MSQKNLDDVATEMLERLYDEAEPPLDFGHLRQNPDQYPEDWYSRHYLDSERQQEIFDEVAEKHDLSDKERSSLSWTVLLDLGPTNVR